MLRIARGSWAWSLGFEFGSFGPLWMREESFRWELPEPRSLLYASDLHLGHWWTRPVAGQILAAVERIQPDVLLFGGDLVDVRSRLPDLQRFIAELAKRTIVAGIPGNHDCLAVGASFRAGGGVWLPETSLAHPIAIDGRIRTGRERADILCAHYPSDFPRAAAAGYRLVLAGHLHGGQCVLASVAGRQYPAAWLHRWHGLRYEHGDAAMLVSRGVGDTLPFRWNCPRELLLCRIEST